MLLLEEKQHLKLLIHTQWDTTIRWICLLVFLKVFFFTANSTLKISTYTHPLTIRMVTESQKGD